MVLGVGAKVHTRIEGPRNVGGSLPENQKVCENWESRVPRMETKIYVGVEGLESACKNSHKSHKACMS